MKKNGLLCVILFALNNGPTSKLKQIVVYLFS